MVAIKVLKGMGARDHSVVKRFVQEAKAASRIGHPNIVDVTDFGTTPDGMTYSVMEFVEGRTLKAVLKDDGPLPTARTLPIIAQLGKALGAAHDKGIVHRDLKPENVFLLDRAGRKDFVKVVDFGIAKVMPLEGAGDSPRLTRAGTVFGTPEYMAPEQAAGRSDTDRRVDVYALGTILYEMLVGKVPHKSESMVRTLAMQMLDPIIPPREARPELDISDELELVMMTALAKKREDRYDNMGQFLDELERVCGGVPLEQPISASTGRVVKKAEVPTLIPTPPGASIAAEQLDTIKPLPADAITAIPESERKTLEKSKSDPAFLHVGDLPLALVDTDDEPIVVPKSRLWPILLILLMIVAGFTVAVLAFTGGGDDKPVAKAALPADAAVLIREIPQDAANLVTEIPLDGGVTGPRPIKNNGQRQPPVVVVPSLPPDAAVSTRMVEVQIITRPERATLYINQSYTGTGDTHVRRPLGTKFTATCRQQGYDPGSVEVVFNGVDEVFLCTMKRVKKCVKDLKNPFDDCPE
jgi:serine/threonine protein kinase